MWRESKMAPSLHPTENLPHFGMTEGTWSEGVELSSVQHTERVLVDP